MSCTKLYYTTLYHIHKHNNTIPYTIHHAIHYIHYTLSNVGNKGDTICGT